MQSLRRRELRRSLEEDIFVGLLIRLFFELLGFILMSPFYAVDAFFEYSENLEEEVAEYVRPTFADWDGGQVMTSVGEACFPVFMVEFQNVKYRDGRVSQEELDRWMFSGEDSVSDYYAVSSHGRLELDGDVYFYTAQGDMEDYENNEALEELILEIFAYYDEEVDFSKYDRNGDFVMDSLVVSVPKGGNEDFWWGATHQWYYNWGCEIDGITIMNYIINDEQPYPNEKRFFLATLEHELGHCMGLPDYYKYTYSGTDYEGMKGIAGKERMDDSEGDFCQFSKLQLGWLKKNQIQIMPNDADKASFYLPPVKEGGCLLIFPKDARQDFQGEYFVVEYNTPEGLQKGLFREGGVRILHVQAEIIKDEYGYYWYKYNNYSSYYDESNEGIRILKLVNDGKGFYREGDVATFENTGGEKGNFGWYTEDGGIRDPGFSVRIVGLNRDGCMEVEVVRDDN